MTPVEIGSQFAGYRIEAVAGEGGMGRVYRATQIALKRPVALKLIVPELADDPGFRVRFERESELAASIEHPNVIPVYEADNAEGRLFIAMRWVEGTDLRSVIVNEGRLEPKRAAAVVTQVGAALDAAHRNGLVHRDVKPANVMLTRHDEEHVYLMDFGLTKRTGAGTAVTKTGQFVGTPDYMAPEQIKGERADARADVYALGCLLFHALTGSTPYDRDSEVAKMYAHINDPPPSVVKAVAGVPAAIDEVIARALAKNPQERYSSAGDLGRAAKAALTGQTASQPERSVATGLAAPAAAAAAGAAAGAAAAGATQMSPEARPSEPAATELGAPPSGTEPPPTEMGAPPSGTEPPPTEMGAPPTEMDAPPTEVDAPPTEMSPAAGSPPASGPPTPATPAAPASQGSPAARASQGSPAAPAAKSPQAPAASGAAERKSRGGVVALLAAGFVALVAAIIFLPGALSGGGESTSTSGGSGSPTVAATIDVGGGPDGVGVDGDDVWVSSANDGTVRKIDGASNKPSGSPLQVGDNPDEVAVADGVVWAVATDDGKVVRFQNDAEKNISVGTAPEGLSLGPQLAWVANGGDDSVTRLDRSTGNRVGSDIPVGDNPIGVFAGKDTVWVTNSFAGTVSRIDASTGQVQGRPIRVGKNIRNVIEGLGSVWVSSTDEDTVTRLDPDSGEVVGTPTKVGDRPKGMAVLDDQLWVTNEGSNSVTRLGADGKVVGSPIRVGRKPVGIAAGPSSLWITNNGSDTVSRIDP